MTWERATCLKGYSIPASYPNNHSCVTVAGRQNAELLDQVDDLFHDYVVAMIRECGSRSDKVTDLVVDVRLAPRIDEVFDYRPNTTRRYVHGRFKKAREDNGEVYDVAHHTANVLFAEKRVHMPNR